MTQKEKAERYDEAIETARKINSGEGIAAPHDFTICEVIFPELKESEDERIKREIIGFIRNAYWTSNRDRFIELVAWLEKQGKTRKITHEEICKSYGIPDIGEFSDGYHTFNGLYKQRMILFAVLVKTYKDRAWKSWKHEDGLDCFGGGWFIVGIDTPAGTYTYHYEAKDWDRFDCKILDKAKHWDGHDEFDVERLFSLLENKESKKREWSEEDEEFLSEIISDIKSAQDKHPDSQMNQIIFDEEVTWLKSLKERCTWKPSEEQMDALEHFVRSIGESGFASPYESSTNLVYSLLSDLKKLKEE